MANHPIVHVEIPANDPKAASKFYADLFGWNIQVDDTFNYHMFQAEGGPGGGFVDTSGEMGYKPGEVLIYVGTDDVAASLAKAESLGATVVMPQTEIPNTGWFGIFTDPTGNRIGLFKWQNQQG